MCTVRYIGPFLPGDPLDVPWVVIEPLAMQLEHREAQEGEGAVVHGAAVEKASWVFARAAKVLVEGSDLDVAALWASVEEVDPHAAVITAAAMVVVLVPKDEGSAEAAMRAVLKRRARASGSWSVSGACWH